MPGFHANCIPSLAWGNVSNIRQFNELYSMTGPEYLLSKHLSAQEHYQSLDQQSTQRHNPVREPFSSTIGIDSGLFNIMTVHSADQRDIPGEVYYVLTHL